LDDATVMDEEKISKSRLTKTTITKFKAMLLEKRSEILQNVASMEDETLRRQRSDLSNMPFHMADAGTNSYEIENTLGLMDNERKLVEEIDDALTRIENGTYGICQVGGERISKERLQAIPWARYCVVCASQVEKGMARQTQSLNMADYDYQPDEDGEGRREEGPYRRAEKL
jgi:DnaK suppressor protein